MKKETKKKGKYPTYVFDGEVVTAVPFSQLHREWMSDPEYKKAYDALEWKYRLYEALIDARNKENVSQHELAEKIGTTQSALSRFESGRGNPTVEFIQKLADALGLTLTITVRKRARSAP